MSAQLSSSPVESVQIGPHTVEIEGSCMLMRIRGPFLIDHIGPWCELADRLIATHGRLFTISDFSTGASMPAETRQCISSWPNLVHVRGAAIFGAGPLVNVMFTMITRAAALIRQHTPPTLAAQTESEARAWIAQLQQAGTA